jgi:hypothetical protein
MSDDHAAIVLSESGTYLAIWEEGLCKATVTVEDAANALRAAGWTVCEPGADERWIIDYDGEEVVFREKHHALEWPHPPRKVTPVRYVRPEEPRHG